VGDEKSEKKLFKLEDLEMWKKAVEIGNKLFDIADRLEEKKLYRFAEQVRAAGLSMSNNIFEGSGSLSRKEFSQFPNIARRSTFEKANMLIVFEMRGLVTGEEKDNILQDLEEECKMISGFIRSLGKG
jgi:four helix bundle protein